MLIRIMGMGIRMRMMLEVVGLVLMMEIVMTMV
jgi:hypothetical protein